MNHAPKTRYNPTPQEKLRALNYLSMKVIDSEKELESVFNSMELRRTLPRVVVKEFEKLLMDIHEFKIKQLGRAVLYEDIVSNPENSDDENKV